MVLFLILNVSIIDNITDIQSISSKRIRQNISPDGFTYLDRGNSRIIFTIDNFEYKGKVLKVARRNHDKGLNKKEAKIYENVIGHPLEEYFCPVVDYDNNGEWLIMEYARTTNNTTVVNEIKSKLEEYDIYPEDVNRNNVGIYNGNPVLIDYAWIPRIK